MSAFSGKTRGELEDFIQALIDQTKCMKVNLDRGNGARGNGEGVWAVCATPEDRAIYDNEMTREKGFKVYLCNQPVGGWCGCDWGCPVIARTNGVSRPVAFEVDQKPLDNEVVHIKDVCGVNDETVD